MKKTKSLLFSGVLPPPIHAPHQPGGRERDRRRGRLQQPGGRHPVRPLRLPQELRRQGKIQIEILRDLGMGIEDQLKKVKIPGPSALALSAL